MRLLNNIILRRLAIAFSGLGLIISLYALYLHYSPVGDSWCDISEAFSCDLVNKGPWSEILGIPVAFFGIPGYGFLLFLALLRPQNWQKWFLLAAFIGIVFSFYLTYLEAFVIMAWCIVCLSSLATIFSSGIVGFLIYKNNRFTKAANL